MAVMWIVFGIFAVMTAALLSGKGAFLIAGYNTSSPAQQAKYDEKKLCRVTGLGMLVITTLILIMALLGDNISSSFSNVFLMITLADVGVMMYLTNTKCFADENSQENAEARVSASDKADKGILTPQKISMGITIVILVIVAFILFTGNISVEYDETSFNIKASYWPDREIVYSDIESIEYCEDISAGRRTGGFGSPRLQMGTFNNEEFNGYTRYCYTKCDACIVMTVKGRIVVLSGEDEESTQKIYEELCSRGAGKEIIMVRPIVRDIFFLGQKSEPAGKEDMGVIRDLLDTLQANREHCVGLAANMIGVKKRIIAVNMGLNNVAMINPEIVKKDTPYETEEGCLSLDGVRKTIRYENIEVTYLDHRFKKQKKKFSGWTAQIIQHEIDHCNGIII